MEQQESHGSTKSYVVGFLLSLVLTAIPIILVVNHSMSMGPLLGVILAMAVVQMFIQLFFFMHVREGEKPRFNVMALILGVVFVVTIVAGSVWVMTFNSQAF